MEKTPIVLEPDRCPAAFHSLLADAPIFDSSCSSAARCIISTRTAVIT